MASRPGVERALADDGVIAALCDEELEPTLALLDRLVREESVEGSDAIQRCLELLDDQLRPLDGRVRHPEYDGLGSLIHEWGDPDGTERLLLCGHTDVVRGGEGWQTPPFELVQRDGWLIGRGVCDMKGALAAFVGALRVLDRLRRLASLPISVVVTADEEVGSRRGMIPLLRDGVVTGTWALCGEPTDLEVLIGNRGLVWLEVELRGEGGHAGLAHELHNPLHLAARVIAALEALPLTARDERFSPPEPSLTVTWLALDEEPVINIVPSAVSLGIDRRLLPAESPKDAIGQIQAVLDERVVPPFAATVRVRGTWPAHIADPAEPLVAAAQSAVAASGRPDTLGTDSATDDSSWLADAGISTILVGPGAPSEAHTVDETVTVADLRAAVEIYVRLGLEFARYARVEAPGA